MSREPTFNPLNLAIAGSFFFQLVAVALPVFAVFTLSHITVAYAWEACKAGEYGPLVRAGTVIQTIAFLYILIEEVWGITPRDLAMEMEDSFRRWHAHEMPEAAVAIDKFRTFAAWSNRVHRPLVRTVETLLVLLGGALSGFGDLIGQWVGPYIS
ncbi:hypothetical protein [Rhizobium sp. CECT 9324]|uniref:hypothetical protein n=1 Tax=Rhizobium sp. CECT 9324 TaxID=2845820 RepID=UPI001E620F8A|nr:hypothetical protein [Rhizobium sp. CECT 9324]CAH0338937.1 hypothetical protein RHI9324_00572 [Rhizobium sp. CECT 9324]